MTKYEIIQKAVDEIVARSERDVMDADDVEGVLRIMVTEIEQITYAEFRATLDSALTDMVRRA